MRQQSARVVSAACLFAAIAAAQAPISSTSDRSPAPTFTPSHGGAAVGGARESWSLPRFDLESLRETAPDLAPERLRRIVRIREAIRQGEYCTRPRLLLALTRALDDAYASFAATSRRCAPRRAASHRCDAASRAGAGSPGSHLRRDITNSCLCCAPPDGLVDFCLSFPEHKGPLPL